jgi:hypothetical protein
MEEDYQQYQDMLRQSRQGADTFDLRWRDDKYEAGPKPQVNENAHFDLNYHHLKKAMERTSGIFGEPAVPPPPAPRPARRPETAASQASQVSHGRVSTLKREIEAENGEGCRMHNGSNLFNLAERQTLASSRSQPRVERVEPLLSHKQAWTDSVPKSWQVDDSADYHKRRYYENMKSSMDTHDHYQQHLGKKEELARS